MDTPQLSVCYHTGFRSTLKSHTHTNSGRKRETAVKWSTEAASPSTAVVRESATVPLCRDPKTIRNTPRTKIAKPLVKPDEYPTLQGCSRVSGAEVTGEKANCSRGKTRDHFYLSGARSIDILSGE